MAAIACVFQGVEILMGKLAVGRIAQTKTDIATWNAHFKAEGETCKLTIFML